MRTDGVECKNYRCDCHDESMCFSCGAQTTTEDPYITICKEYRRRTPEHEAVVKTLKKLSQKLKQSHSKGWFMSESVFYSAIRTLARNWIKRGK